MRVPFIICTRVTTLHSYYTRMHPFSANQRHAIFSSTLLTSLLPRVINNQVMGILKLMMQKLYRSNTKYPKNGSISLEYVRNKIEIYQSILQHTCLTWNRFKGWTPGNSHWLRTVGEPLTLYIKNWRLQLITFLNAVFNWLWRFTSYNIFLGESSCHKKKIKMTGWKIFTGYLKA